MQPNFSGQAGWTAAWSLVKNSWNSAIQQRITNLQNVSAALQRVG